MLPAPVSAGVVISEIMYDLPGADEGREWIEIENSSDVSVNLTGWRFVEAGVNHKLIPVGSPLIPPRSFAIIARDSAAFRADWPAFQGVLFESSFSLSNSGEMIALRDASSTPAASSAYSSTDGAGGDGNSLNADGARWKKLMPSPGLPPSLSAIVAVPKPEPSRELQKPRNLSPVSSVRVSTGGSAPALASSAQKPLTASAVNALQASTSGAESANPFAILPWIGGLLLISLGGVAAVLLGRQKGSSGYEITEEES